MRVSASNKKLFALAIYLLFSDLGKKVRVNGNISYSTTCISSICYWLDSAAQRMPRFIISISSGMLKSEAL